MTRTAVVSLLTLLLVAAPASADEGGVLYPALYYPGVADSALADPILVGAGQTWTGVEIAMESAGGSLRGRLVLQGGAGPQPEPLDGVLVEAFSRGRRVLTRTGAEGWFRLSGVPAGVAVVRYSTDDEHTRETRAQAAFHPGVPDLENAARISVADGREIDLGAVALRPGARLGGRVRTGDGGAPMAGIEVRILSLGKSSGPSPAEGSADGPGASFPGDGGVWLEHTRADGRFLQGGLPPGDYTVFADVHGTDHISEYLGGTRDLLGAEIVSLRGGEERLDLEIAPDRGGGIGGEVREEGAGGPLPGVEVQAIDESSGEVYRGVTGPFGGYRIGGLPAGRYLVFVPAIRKYYPDARRPEDARVLVVNEPRDLLGVNLRGVPGGGCQLPSGLQGTVTGGIIADFTSVERAIVRAWSQADTFEMPIEFPGPYALTCMKAGSYRVALLVDGPLRAQYHKKTNDPAQATLVTVTAADSSFGIDFSPDRAARIEGRVRDARSGAGIEGVLVSAVETRTRARAEARTGPGGGFVLDRLGAPGSPEIRTGLPAGSWRVAAETTLVEDPIVTPVLQPEIRARLEAPGSVRVEWELPPGPIWSYEVHRDGGDEPVRIDSAAAVSGAAGPFSLVDRPPATGRFRYRLSAWTRLPGEPPVLPFRAESEWIAVELASGSPATARWRIRSRPSPWNGRGTMRLLLESHGPGGESSGNATGGPPEGWPAGRIRILHPSGRSIAECSPEPGTRAFLWNGRDASGRPVPSGLYLLRHEPQDPRSERGARGASGVLLLVR